MQLIESLEQEVWGRANQATDQMLIELIERLLQQESQSNSLTEKLYLIYCARQFKYVQAKRIYAKFKAGKDPENLDLIKDHVLSELVKTSRHAYYQARARMEGDHESSCQCKTCRYFADCDSRIRTTITNLLTKTTHSGDSNGR